MEVGPLVGTLLGVFEGIRVALLGAIVVGSLVGTLLGAFVLGALETLEGNIVAPLGDMVGANVIILDGMLVGLVVGDKVVGPVIVGATLTLGATEGMELGFPVDKSALG